MPSRIHPAKTSRSPMLRANWTALQPSNAASRPAPDLHQKPAWSWRTSASSCNAYAMKMPSIHKTKPTNHTRTTQHTIGKKRHNKSIAQNTQKHKTQDARGRNHVLHDLRIHRLEPRRGRSASTRGLGLAFLHEGTSLLNGRNGRASPSNVTLVLPKKHECRH